MESKTFDGASILEQGRVETSLVAVLNHILTWAKTKNR